MEDARIDGALIVQPINHKFDHSLVTRSLSLSNHYASLILSLLMVDLSCCLFLFLSVDDVLLGRCFFFFLVV